MLVRALRLTNLRAHRHLEVELEPGLNVLVGPNGAGKPTVLEAANLVLCGSMLRPGTVRDLMTKGQDFLRVEARLEDAGAAVTAAVAMTREGERKATADGATLEDFSRWEAAAPVRSFVPDDLRLIKGSPRRRREHLDLLCSRWQPDYRGVLRKYDEALGQRNALLRSARSGEAADHFAPWEAILAEAGLAVVSRRSAALASFVGAFQQTYGLLAGDRADSIRLIYRTNVADMDEAAYRARLASSRAADQQRTFTHLGPHRDDLRFVRRELDMRDCASQGEQRAALLALVLAEWAYLFAPSQKPLLLLDDVMSELDENRRRALVGLLRQGGQTVVTTTDLRYFSEAELADAHIVDLPAVDSPNGVGTAIVPGP